MALSFYITWGLYYCGGGKCIMKTGVEAGVDEFCKLKRGLNVA